MTWHKVKQLIDKHSLPYRVERWNMSLRGCLVDSTGRSVANSTVQAMRFLRKLK